MNGLLEFLIVTALALTGALLAGVAGNEADGRRFISAAIYGYASIGLLILAWGVGTT